MTYKNIMLTDKGLKAFNAPFKPDPFYNDEDRHCYKLSLQQAINEGLVKGIEWYNSLNQKA